MRNEKRVGAKRRKQWGSLSIREGVEGHWRDSETARRDRWELGCSDQGRRRLRPTQGLRVRVSLVCLNPRSLASGSARFSFLPLPFCHFPARFSQKPSFLPSSIKVLPFLLLLFMFVFYSVSLFFHIRAVLPESSCIFFSIFISDGLHFITCLNLVSLWFVNPIGFAY